MKLINPIIVLIVLCLGLNINAQIISVPMSPTIVQSEEQGTRYLYNGSAAWRECETYTERWMYWPPAVVPSYTKTSKVIYAFGNRLYSTIQIDARFNGTNYVGTKRQTDYYPQNQSVVLPVVNLSSQDVFILCWRMPSTFGPANGGNKASTVWNYMRNAIVQFDHLWLGNTIEVYVDSTGVAATPRLGEVIDYFRVTQQGQPVYRFYPANSMMPQNREYSGIKYIALTHAQFQSKYPNLK